MVTNPPYGERMLSAATANEGIGSLMGELHDSGWGLFALSGDASFEEEVGRMRSQVFGRGRERESGQCMRGEREKERESERARESERDKEGGREEGRKGEGIVCVCYTPYTPAARCMALQMRGYLCTAYRQQQLTRNARMLS